jgi:hypothetical protein
MNSVHPSFIQRKKEMGGECYHFVHLKEAIEIPASATADYEKVLPVLVQKTLAWWEKVKPDDKIGWTVEAAVSTGIFIKFPENEREYNRNPISFPPTLDATLLVGWERVKRGSIKDPKFEIAERLIGALKAHLTRDTWALFDDNAEDEYGLARWQPNSHRTVDKFTPYTGYYSTGNGDVVFSSRGEERDFTACSSECGYCGRCGY